MTEHQAYFSHMPFQDPHKSDKPIWLTTATTGCQILKDWHQRCALRDNTPKMENQMETKTENHIDIGIIIGYLRVI